MEKEFSTLEAAKLANLSPTMVDYLCREGIVIPSKPKQRRRGARRRYLFGEVVLLRVVSKLLNRGVSVKRIKDSLKTKNAYFRDLRSDIDPLKLFVTDGKNVYLPEPDKKTGLIDLNNEGQMAFGFIIDIRAEHQSVRDEVLRAKAS